MKTARKKPGAGKSLSRPTFAARTRPARRLAVAPVLAARRSALPNPPPPNPKMSDSLSRILQRLSDNERGRRERTECICREVERREMNRDGKERAGLVACVIILALVVLVNRALLLFVLGLVALWCVIIWSRRKHK